MTDSAPEPAPRNPDDPAPAGDGASPPVWRQSWFRVLALLLVLLGFFWRCA